MRIADRGIRDKNRTGLARRPGQGAAEQKIAPILKITPKQIRALWGFASRLTLPEEELREWIFRRTGKNSLRALTRPQASRLIEEISRKGERRAGLSPLHHEMTPGQAGILALLEREIGWDDRRLLGLARKMYHVERLQALRPEEAAGLIEALKAIRRRNAA